MRTERRVGRIDVDIPVIVTTVLDSSEASISDLTEFGALIRGCAVDAGERIQINYMGQIVFARCRWAEVDRMGIKFLLPLSEGPLFERLLYARAAQGDGTEGLAAPTVFVRPNRPSALGARTFGRGPTNGSFGRRH